MLLGESSNEGQECSCGEPGPATALTSSQVLGISISDRQEEVFDGCVKGTLSVLRSWAEQKRRKKGSTHPLDIGKVENLYFMLPVVKNSVI